MTREAPRGRWRHAGSFGLLALGLVAASYPAWRVALFGSRPTLEELLQFTCSATGPAGPPQWLIRRGAVTSIPAAAALPPLAGSVRSPQDRAADALRPSTD